MERDLFVGIDLGTTGVKAGLFDAAGAPRAAAAREFQMRAPAPGMAEFDGAAYAAAALEAVGEVLAAPGVDRAAVRAIGFSSQGQTFVLLDGQDRPVRPAIGWLDVRAGAEAAELSARLGRSVNAIASAPKILWLARHEPESLRRARRVLLLPDYLICRLTGRAASDPATAGSTGLYDREAGGWLGAAAEACGIDAGALPEVLPAGSPAGTLRREAARTLGLAEDTLVATGTNDQYAGAIGAGNVTEGCASAALGTALAIIATARAVGRLPEGLRMSPHPAAPAGVELQALLAYAKTSGVVLRWFRDTCAGGMPYDEILGRAARIPAGAEGLTCLPHFSGTATPDFDPDARGAFYGLTLSHTRDHVARAIVESLSFTVRENLALIERAVAVTVLRAIGGGARSDVWLQMIADVTGRPLERPRVREAACLGAAALAMVAAGRYASGIEAARRVYAADAEFAPRDAHRTACDDAFARYCALRRALYGRAAPSDPDASRAR